MKEELWQFIMSTQRSILVTYTTFESTWYSFISPPRSPDLWFLSMQVCEGPCVPDDLSKLRILTAVETITPDMLIKVWEEFDYRLDDVFRTRGGCFHPHVRCACLRARSARGTSDVTRSRRAGLQASHSGCVRIRVGFYVVCGQILVGHWGDRTPCGVSAGRDRV